MPLPKHALPHQAKRCGRRAGGCASPDTSLLSGEPRAIAHCNSVFLGRATFRDGVSRDSGAQATFQSRVPVGRCSVRPNLSAVPSSSSQGAAPRRKPKMLSRSVVFFLLHLLIIDAAVALANLSAEIGPAVASLQ